MGRGRERGVRILGPKARKKVGETVAFVIQVRSVFSIKEIQTTSEGVP